jgi:hypothetical protein
MASRFGGACISFAGSSLHRRVSDPASARIVPNVEIEVTGMSMQASSIYESVRSASHGGGTMNLGPSMRTPARANR